MRNNYFLRLYFDENKLTYDLFFTSETSKKMGTSTFQLKKSRQNIIFIHECKTKREILLAFFFIMQKNKYLLETCGLIFCCCVMKLLNNPDIMIRSEFNEQNSSFGQKYIPRFLSLTYIVHTVVHIHTYEISYQLRHRKANLSC